jgi:hypothetical protein
MSTQLEKLKELQKLRDPNSAMTGVLQQLLAQVQVMKGEPGYTPVKGKDYLTESEVGSIISYIQSNIRVPKDGKDGKDGINGAVGPRGPKGDSVVGPQGERGPAGPQGPVGETVSLDEDTIAQKIMQKIVESKEWKDMTNKAFYSKFDQRWHGGNGGTQTIFMDDETLIGDVNGVNAVFTVTYTPISGSLKVYRGGARQRVTEDYTVNGNEITFIIPPQPGEILLADYRHN